MDIPLAGWILSVIAFIVGTLIPIIYRRFSHEGFSLKQMLDVKAFIDDPEHEGELTINFILKLANAQKESVLIDEIKVYEPKLNINDIVFQHIRTELRLLGLPLEKEIVLPPSTNPGPGNFIDYLPFVIKSDDEKVLAIGVRYRYQPSSNKSAVFVMNNQVAKYGLKIAFRINGKYRDYLFRLTPKKEDAVNI